MMVDRGAFGGDSGFIMDLLIDLFEMRQRVDGST